LIIGKIIVGVYFYKRVTYTAYGRNLIYEEKTVEAYTGFAKVYDKFMDNIDYVGWCSYLVELLQENNINNDTIAELGCGTGNVTEILAEKGYNVIGIDCSQEMLEIAAEKLYGSVDLLEKQGQIIYVCQDMRELELPDKVSAVVSLCDSMNYITEYEDLVRVLKNVKKYLKPDGVFIFDLKTVKYFSDIGECIIAEDREDCSFIWDNYFDDNDFTNEYRLSLFLQGKDGRYDKFTEEHYQRAYFIKEIKTAAIEAGMTVSAMYNAFTRENACEENDRIYVILKH
jgi:ubiquinone/menaquinone biosynthesis C-methylase UbiE